MPTHHEIKINLVGGVSVEAEPSPVLRVGDTVRYSSPDGTTRVFFPTTTPYPVNEVADAQIHTLEKPGLFQFQCFVKPTGQTQEVGWSPQSPKAGGEHDVKT